MADISEIKSTTRTIEIVHPGSKNNIGIRVQLLSIDDDALNTIKRKITDRRLYLEARGKTFKASEIEENARELQHVAMKGWEWYNPTGKEGDADYDADAMPSFHGEVPDFNRKNVMAVLTELSWFGEQLGKEFSETEAFFGN